MFLSDSNHMLCQSYLSKDKLNQYRRILDSSPGLRKFSVQGCSGGDADRGSSYGTGNGTSSFSSSVNDDDEFVVELSTLLFLYQGQSERQACDGNDADVDKDNGDIDAAAAAAAASSSSAPAMPSSTIEELRLESFKITENGWRTLTNLFQSLSSLRILYLRRILIVDAPKLSNSTPNNVEDNDDDDDDDDDVTTIPARTFGTILRLCPNLTELHIVDCDVDSMTAQRISHDLTRTSSLKVLSLEGNSIGNIGVKYLAKALKQPKQQQLHKSNTATSQKNSRSQNKCRLQALDIERVGCSMKDGLTFLALALKDNDTLESLSCGGNSGLDDETILVDVVVNDDDDYGDTNKSNRKNETPQQQKTSRQRHPFHELLLTNSTLRTVQPLLRFPSKIVPSIDLYLRMNRAGRKHVLITNVDNDDKCIGNKPRNKRDGILLPKVFHYILEKVSNDSSIIFEFLKLQTPSQSNYFQTTEE